MSRIKSNMPSVSEIIKAIKSSERATGRKVTAVKHNPDGSFRVLTAEHISKTISKIEDDPTLSGWDDVVRHGQA